MKNKKSILSLVLLICICLIGFFSFKEFFTTQTASVHRNITDVESSYNADAEILEALEQVKKSQDKATILTHSNSSEPHIALTFDGLTDRVVMQQILDLLHKYNMKATFFVDGLQTAEDPKVVMNIKKEGQKVENYTLTGMVKMENLLQESLVKDFVRSQKIIKVTTDQGPNLLKCNETKYTDQLLQAAKASGFKSVVRSDAYVDVKQLKSLEAADKFVAQIKTGSIVSLRLKTQVEPIESEPEKTDLKPAIDKQPGLKVLPKLEELENKETVDAVEKLLIALTKAKYTTVYVEDLSVFPGIPKPVKTTFLEYKDSFSLEKLFAFVQEEIGSLLTCRTAYAAEDSKNEAKEIKVILTTEPALSYSFGGISKETVVNDVLERLNCLDIKGTFFVAEVEMKKYPATVRKIIENGHEIGIAVNAKNGENLEDARNEILRGRKILEEQFGVSTNLVKQPYGVISGATKEAVASLGCNLIGQSMNVVQNKHKDYATADQVMGEIFGKFAFSLARGQIIYFRMDFYTTESLVGDLMEAVKKYKVDNISYATSYDNPINNLANNSRYTIKPVGQVLNNTKFLYQYPVDINKVPAYLRTNPQPLKIDDRNFLAESSKRYIGNETVDANNRAIGFTKQDLRRLDLTGMIKTKENVIFLTFDDWGTDASINKILYVLRKHKVSGTFFVLTNNVLNNPNLLRTIALEGHEIASHTDKHKPMAVRDVKTGKQYRTQDKEEYNQDLATSYEKLRNVVGDVNLNGKDALTRLFRPPTLAISKMGFETLFETGFEYIVNGSGSTADYKVGSVTELLGGIKEGVYTDEGGVKKGAVIVMHQGDNSQYTAMAIDILLTANEAKADSDPSKFKVGRLSDYLNGNYSQVTKKNHETKWP